MMMMIGGSLKVMSVRLLECLQYSTESREPFAFVHCFSLFSPALLSICLGSLSQQGLN